jgi:hypothetical protein
MDNEESKEICDKCNGNGYFRGEPDKPLIPCEKCFGDGYIDKNKIVKEKIDWEIHKQFLFAGEFECGYCHKRFPMFYLNKGKTYWGNRGRYNFRGAMANFIRHIRVCKKKYNA